MPYHFTAMVPTMVTRAMQRKADELLARRHLWAEGVRNRDGMRFLLFPSRSTASVYYFTRFDGHGCSCPAARFSRNADCYHQLAAREAVRQAQEAPMPPACVENDALSEVY